MTIAKCSSSAELTLVKRAVSGEVWAITHICKLFVKDLLIIAHIYNHKVDIIILMNRIKSPFPVNENVW